MDINDPTGQEPTLLDTARLNVTVAQETSMTLDVIAGHLGYTRPQSRVGYGELDSSDLGTLLRATKTVLQDTDHDVRALLALLGSRGPGTIAVAPRSYEEEPDDAMVTLPGVPVPTDRTPRRLAADYNRSRGVTC